ncbi:RagB/SusD family nutrient uptake outer membrane protein [Flavobacterium sp. 5]|uniref:RagB/SusD family nutrient uptake outer membrane protein n=1 Tax=Flavobacterium sp. 5 TaxID=2035199 RepID=UPI000C2B99CF|nr:RagB/SusD family nutrient uptake outer membrane protein [Flavobacterium sp. 5]PKB15148.1 putative outer membrane starch-binding protein [Flavobacterium sp. 5]
MRSNQIVLFVAAMLAVFSSCQDDFLEKEPKSQITPEKYLDDESQLAAYTINLYNVFPVMENYGRDSDTDTEADRGYDNRYVPGQWLVPDRGGDWDFGNIYQCNYFMGKVIPKWKKNEITGNPSNVDHYIGEMYFLRAYIYFQKLVALGDFPILKFNPDMDIDQLTALSQRNPRNEVARFIISDLDSATTLMHDFSPDGKGNRLSKQVALLMKSRVALYEGTWEKYFKGTPFVPNGPGWPGLQKDYNKNYQFPSGSIDGEIDYFLTQAMNSSKAAADHILLTPNTQKVEVPGQSYLDFAKACDSNPYLGMFSKIDLSPYNEVLLWRAFDVGLGVGNSYAIGVQSGGDGYTRGFVDNCLMANGLPIYAPGSGYAGDDYLADVRTKRDMRLNLWLAEPGQINILYPSALNTHGTDVAIVPDIMNLLGNHDQPTGYHHTKGNNYDGVNYGQHTGSSMGSIAFRGVEAYLNYIEASYEKNGSIDGTASSYWKQIRERAGVDSDFNKTIAATDMSMEAKNDWGAYSEGSLIDATLYNIRRERRVEMLGEGFRLNDLKRWRAMDQMISTPYQIEGFKLWGPMKDWYNPAKLTYGIGDKSTVSDPAISSYLRVNQKNPTTLAYNGYRWTMAHYLSPIAMQHFLITSPNGDASGSPIYQNPNWPTTANSGPTN